MTRKQSYIPYLSKILVVMQMQSQVWYGLQSSAAKTMKGGKKKKNPVHFIMHYGNDIMMQTYISRNSVAMHHTDNVNIEP